MLYQITIENIALIDKLILEFHNGLCIMTGETGAGKSIIVDAVGLVLGGRADRELIKNGAERALVEAVFDIHTSPGVNRHLEELGIPPEEGMLILSRELSANGRNVCRINSRLVTLAALKEISQHLVDIHGQHEHQSLLQVENHILFLDQYGGASTAAHLDNVKSAYERWKEVTNQLKARFGNEHERERRMDMLRFQITEISEAKLKPGEEEALNKQRELFLHGEKISKAFNKAYQIIYGGNEKASSIMDGLGKILADFSEVSHLESVFTNLHKRLDEVYYSLEDISFEIRDMKDQYDYDPRLIDEIEKRLDIIAGLKRKYGKSIDEILFYLEKAKKDLDELENNQQMIEILEKEKCRLQKSLFDASRDLSYHRRQLAVHFEQDVMKQLSELGMTKAQFQLMITSPDEAKELEELENAFTDRGFDRIEFLISANPGEPPKPLAKIISGGEMSRVMLALKSIAANIDEVGCLIFDEIDTGISGRIAQAVAEKMSKISDSHQVICITHLPQIASMADTHYLIEKTSEKETTRTHVKKLSMEERYQEIARMLGGAGISMLGLKHAKEMVQQAGDIKVKIRSVS